MRTVSSVCEKCGAKIPADARQGVCPACQLETGLGLLVNESAEATNPTPRPRIERATRQPRMLGDFGDYEVQEEIGRGGQGVVYRARQKSLNRTVALKVIGLGHWATEAHLKRFRREAEAAASLDHSGIVPIHEVGERDGSCYFSMKFVEGGQLDAVVKREPMPIRRGVELIAKIARTVHYAHEHGILHRDIKPGNILLDQKGEPHLTDFGLARLVETESTVTRTLEVLGTPSYMAPEQAVGNNAGISSATDVYGLGAVLYQLLTGQPPFAGGTTYETIKLLLDTEPRRPRLLNPKIDRDLSTICLKCLEKDPKRRYPSALALAEDLEHWLKHEPIRAHRTGVLTRARKWVRRNPSIAVMAAMLLALAVPLGVMIWKSETEQLPASNLVAPEKSIAVLPFSNLSKEPENAFFADGVQDEILADLARIADLKVISRTSVMHYKSPASAGRNLREIGRQLAVANVVEGSVQRIGKRVRVNAQLVDTRTDRHLWGQTYDRDLSDVFAIQSEIAKTIADQLHAKLSPSEEVSIERPSTTDINAFDLYTRAKNILLVVPERTKAELLEAVDLLNQAVGRDPSFFDAYCQLGYAHDYIYWRGDDPTSARLGYADAAIQAAARLRPDAGETHLARACNLYWGYRDYDDALSELEVARQTLPNDARMFEWVGNIKRRQGHWEESTRNYERSVELNPRDIGTRTAIAGNYESLRRYAEAKSDLARTLALFPNDVGTRLEQGYLQVAITADTRPSHQMLDSIRATNPAARVMGADPWLWCAIADRDATAAKNALESHSETRIDFGGEIFFSRSFVEGLIARMTKDAGKAQAAFTAARAEQEKIVQAQPNDSRALCLLGLIDAGLGRREDALREGRRAVGLLPVEKDAIVGVDLVEHLAIIAAWVGDKDLAFEQLDTIIRRPSFLSYGELKLMPFWDPLRDDPRFEKILEEAKQPVTIETTASSAPEQSVAVLPFENLSDDKEHAFFADGVQDDILIKLAKIAELKVISRTSVMQYRGKQDVRQIGNALRVSHILEGTVRRSGGKLHVNAQLVDARTDEDIWAEEYDRDLNDLFSIETEVAQSIANRLRAKVSARERAAIQERPTKDLAAYDFYVRAIPLIEGEAFSPTKEKDIFQALGLLEQAVTRDSTFLLAYCWLARAHDSLYHEGIDHTPARLALAKSAIDSAFRLRADSGDAHLALGLHLYWGYFDYPRARAELDIARRTLPNNPHVFEITAFIDRRQGRWSDALRDIERASELDPRNFFLAGNVAVFYFGSRPLPYEQTRNALDRVLALKPNFVDSRIDAGGGLEMHWRGDTRHWHATIDKILSDEPASANDPAMKQQRLQLALFERDFIAANRAVAALPQETLDGFSRDFWMGVVARAKRDAAASREAFTAARAEQEAVVRAQPDAAAALSILGIIDAGLERKGEALREGRRAVELMPIAKDAADGPGLVYNLAWIYAWTGERDLAIEQLEIVSKVPAGPTYGMLRLDPIWDSLRGDARFEKIVASLSPK